MSTNYKACRRAEIAHSTVGNLEGWRLAVKTREFMGK